MNLGSSEQTIFTRTPEFTKEVPYIGFRIQLANRGQEIERQVYTLLDLISDGGGFSDGLHFIFSGFIIFCTLPYYEISRINSVFKIFLKQQKQSLSEKVEAQLEESTQFEDEPARKRLDRVMKSKLDSDYKLNQDDVTFLVNQSISQYASYP
jgi:hypothetical protein